MFDPYHAWLGISPEEQPASHYRMLGIRDFESEINVISNAADRQMGFVRQNAAGPNKLAAQEVLNRLAAAKLCLLSPVEKSAYDLTLSSDREAAQLQAMRLQAAPLEEPVAVESFAAPDFLTPAAAQQPGQRPRKSKPAAGPSYSQAIAFAAVFAALVGVLYAWRMLDQQKAELVKAQAIIDQSEQTPKTPDRKTPDPAHPPATKSPPMPQPKHGSAMRTPSAVPRRDPAVPHRVVDVSAANPAVDEPQAVAARVSAGPPTRVETPAAETPPVEMTRESFANRAWRIELPGGRSLTDRDIRIPDYAEGMITAKTPTYAWRSANLTGYFKFTQADKTLFQIDGAGVTIYDEARPRTFAKYKKGDRDGELWMLDETGGPILFAHFNDDDPEGLLCYCAAGVPALIQERQRKSATERYLVVAKDGKLSAELPSGDRQGECLKLESQVTSLLSQLEKEHSERNVSFRRWVRDEQEKQRRQMVSKLAPIKRQNAALRAKKQAAEDDANMKRIMRGSRGY